MTLELDPAADDDEDEDLESRRAKFLRVLCGELPRPKFASMSAPCPASVFAAFVIRRFSELCAAAPAW